VHSLGRGLAAISLSGRGGTGVGFSGSSYPSSGGNWNAAAASARLPPGLVNLSSNGGNTGGGAA
jgi:hypothetical protein